MIISYLQFIIIQFMSLFYNLQGERIAKIRIIKKSKLLLKKGDLFYYRKMTAKRY